MLAKALGTGVEGFALNEVSCLRDELGCPYLELTGNALLATENRGLTFAVSLSHIKDIASAVVIAYGFFFCEKRVSSFSE